MPRRIRQGRGRAPLAAEQLEPRVVLAAPGTGWQLLWSDDFNGAALDQSKWDVTTGPRRQAVNTADAVTVADGALTITTYTAGGPW